MRGVIVMRAMIANVALIVLIAGVEVHAVFSLLKGKLAAGHHFMRCFSAGDTLRLAVAQLLDSGGLGVGLCLTLRNGRFEIVRQLRRGQIVPQRFCGFSERQDSLFLSLGLFPVLQQLRRLGIGFQLL